MTLEELAGKLTQIKIDLERLLDGLNDGITGDIRFLPPPIPMKIRRKRRTKREMSASGIPPVAGMSDLPEDIDPFFAKVKKERKKREKKGVEES